MSYIKIKQKDIHKISVIFRLFTNLLRTLLYIYMFMHTLHLHFGPSQVLLHSLIFGNDVSDFIFDGRLFHIFGPMDFKLWVSNLLVFIRLTMMSFCH